MAPWLESIAHAVSAHLVDALYQPNIKSVSHKTRVDGGFTAPANLIGATDSKGGGKATGKTDIKADGKAMEVAQDESEGKGDEEKVETDEQEDLPEQNGEGLEDWMAGKVKGHKEYKLLVDTGGLPSSFTHGDVYIQLLGTRDNSSLIHLKTGFNPSTRTEFSVFAVDVGKIEKIRLVANTTDRWFCDRVWLDSPEGAREFPVGQFIGWPNTPEVIVGPALAALGPGGVVLALALAASRSRFPVTSGGPDCRTWASLQARLLAKKALWTDFL